VRILYLSHRVPYPPNTGERIRIFHHLRHLTAAHEVHLLSFADRDDDGGSAAHLRESCRSVELVPLPTVPAAARAAVAVMSGGSLTAAYFDAAAMRAAMARAAARTSFDVVWASSSALAPLLPGVQARRRVVDFIDVDSEKWREFARHTSPPLAWLYGLEAARLHRLEAQIAATADSVLVASDSEAALLRRALPSAPLRVVQNGVDTRYFHPVTRANSARPPQLVFCGSLDYRPNIEAVLFFLDNVLPLVRRRAPDVEFTAVGHRPPGALLRAARRAGVRVAGSVPDARPFLAAADICVVPLRFGRGVKNKVLEAMAMGVPVVATRVAVEGLAVRDGVQLLIADTAADFATAVTELISDRARRDALAVAALRYVQESHRWENTLRELDEMLED
jgi:sugar transferase (PEP-CTERM/EpsH1 system associated)